MKKISLLLVTGILSMAASGFSGWSVPWMPLGSQKITARLPQTVLSSASTSSKSKSNVFISSLSDSFRAGRLLSASA